MDMYNYALCYWISGWDGIGQWKGRNAEKCGVRIHHTFETKEVPGSGHHGRVALHREDCGAGTLVVEVALVVATCQGLGYAKKNGEK